MNRDELQRLSEDRIEDAKALLAAERWSAAFYMSGYSIECALKACVAKQIKQFDFPDKAFLSDLYIHDLSKLLKKAGLEKERQAKEAESPDFKNYWKVVTSWSEQSRYETRSEAEARDLLLAIGDEEGVLSWVKQHW
jgi:hypothetical protein